MSKICDAIKHLPHRFITTELVMEAAQEHNTELLDYLPQEFVTPDVISEVFAGEMNSYYWKFDLSLIPVEYRTEDICRKALKCSTDNMIHIPAHIIDAEMVDKALSSTHRLQFLPLIPQHLWTEAFVYKVLKTVRADYSDGRYLSGSSEAEVIRKCQVIMSLMPERLKTRSFYHGLFGEGMAAAVISAITPKRYRDTGYYRLMAAYDVERVPNAKLNRELVLVALGEDSRSDIQKLFREAQRREVIFDMMDNHIADIFVTKQPSFFVDLPKRFQTSTRLALTVRTTGEQGNSYFRIHYDERLLTLKVIKEFIRQGIECQIPEKFWNRELVEFCVQSNKSPFWFTQMPKELQTEESVTLAVRYSHYYLSHALKQNITKEVAVEVVRAVVSDNYYNSSRDNIKYLPESYFTEFKKKTGLPEKFMGGEVDFATLKEDRKTFTYCRIGNIYAGFYNSGYGKEEHNLIVSRVDKGKAPKTLYEGCVTAFHKTWLEKPIAENDGNFIKPTVDPSLKDVQGVGYYGVETLNGRDGFDIYANTFCGMTVGYCVKKDELTYHDNSIEAALAGWHDKVEKARQAEKEEGNIASVQSDVDAIVFTAEMLHRKYGFCETGMTAFVNDYGLDYNGRYSVGYLRQVIALQGPKPSLQSYGRELRQIKVIR